MVFRTARVRKSPTSEVAEAAAASLAGGEAGGAGASLGLQGRRAAAAFIGQRGGNLETPLLVGRAAIRAQAGLRESGELLGQRRGLGERLALRHQSIGQ